MYTRTLFCLSATLAFGLCGGVGLANPSHGGAHPAPKSHPPAKKAANGNASSSTSAHKGGANAATNPSTATQHPAHKDAVTHQKKDEHRDKEFRGNENRRDMHELERLQADLDRMIRSREEEHHRGYAMKNKNGQTNYPYQQQNGQQPYQSQFGQQGSGQQQPGGQGGAGQQQNASTGDPDSTQPQVAQEQESPGPERSRHGLASDGLQQAERLLMAAIHQLEEALSGDEGHRHHHLAEANRLLGEAARCSEAAGQMARAYEEPHMEAAPHGPRS